MGLLVWSLLALLSLPPFLSPFPLILSSSFPPSLLSPPQNSTWSRTLLLISRTRGTSSDAEWRMLPILQRAVSRSGALPWTLCLHHCVLSSSHSPFYRLLPGSACLCLPACLIFFFFTVAGIHVWRSGGLLCWSHHGGCGVQSTVLF